MTLKDLKNIIDYLEKEGVSDDTNVILNIDTESNELLSWDVFPYKK